MIWENVTIDRGRSLESLAESRALLIVADTEKCSKLELLDELVIVEE